MPRSGSRREQADRHCRRKQIQPPLVALPYFRLGTGSVFLAHSQDGWEARGTNHLELAGGDVVQILSAVASQADDIDARIVDIEENIAKLKTEIRSATFTTIPAQAMAAAERLNLACRVLPPPALPGPSRLRCESCSRWGGRSSRRGRTLSSRCGRSLTVHGVRPVNG